MKSSSRPRVFLSLLAGVASLAGCARVAPNTQAHAARAAVAPTNLLQPVGSRIAVAFHSAFVASIQQDQSVGNSGALGSTVNEVVPIPGTDMIRAGSVQEGSLFQSNFRNPTEDASVGGGAVPTAATILFRITRP